MLIFTTESLILLILMFHVVDTDVGGPCQRIRDCIDDNHGDIFLRIAGPSELIRSASNLESICEEALPNITSCFHDYSDQCSDSIFIRDLNNSIKLIKYTCTTYERDVIGLLQYRICYGNLGMADRSAIVLLICSHFFYDIQLTLNPDPQVQECELLQTELDCIRRQSKYYCGIEFANFMKRTWMVWKEYYLRASNCTLVDQRMDQLDACPWVSTCIRMHGNYLYSWPSNAYKLISAYQESDSKCIDLPPGDDTQTGVNTSSLSSRDQTWSTREIMFQCLNIARLSCSEEKELRKAYNTEHLTNYVCTAEGSALFQAMSNQSQDTTCVNDPNLRATILGWRTECWRPFVRELRQPYIRPYNLYRAVNATRDCLREKATEFCGPDNPHLATLVDFLWHENKFIDVDYLTRTF